MQNDNNFVVYKKVNGQFNKPLWNSGTNKGPQGSYKLIFQTDNNLVVYDNNGSSKWAAMSTLGKPAPMQLRMQDDGNLVI